MTVSLDPTDFWGPADWAAAYRQLGIAVVPATVSSDGKRKHPIARWQEFQENGIPQAVHDRWYAHGGSHIGDTTMGFLTGRASLEPGKALLGIDVDVKEGKGGLQTWHGWMDAYNNSLPLETWSALTGSGGRHLYFWYPDHIEIRNTQETIDGIDVRGHGGFIMAPPSRHYLPGKEYKWAEGFAPWETDLLQAPDWLVELVLSIGEISFARTKRIEATETPDRREDVFGNTIDGRDKKMADHCYAAILDAYRLCPIPPSGQGVEAIAQRAYETYAATTESRVERDGRSKHERLEAEGRGISAVREKIRRHLRNWETHVRKAAMHPPRSVLEKKLVEANKGNADELAILKQVAEWFVEGNHPDAEWLVQAIAGIAVGRDHMPDNDNASGFGEGPKPRFPFETIGDLRNLPPAKWLVDGWVPENATGILYGKWAAGKSFIGFDLALHLAYGLQDWHGAKLPEEECDVLIIAREGHQGFVQRIDAFKRFHGLPDDTGRVEFMRASVSFMRDEEFNGLCLALKERGRKYRLTLVDTVARVLPGVDMNEQQTVTLFMERCGILANIAGGSVVGVHHQNKGGDMMGSIYFEANADFVFEVTRTGSDDDPLTEGEITCTKMKDGEDRWKRGIKYERIPLTLAAEGPASLVVGAIGDVGERAKLPSRDTCKRILAAIDAAWRQGSPLSHKARAKSEGRYAQRVLGADFKLPPEVIERLIIAWLDSDHVAFEQADPKTKRMGLRVLKWLD